MIDITVSEELKSLCPDFVGAALIAEVKNSAHNEELSEEITTFSKELKSSIEIADIRYNKQIAATREAYKTFGKNPNRYRPAAEALQRRILRDISLYQIDTLVDLINLISIKTGYSIGGFDLDKIEGKQLILGIGKADENFEGIGKGLLNIEGLPVYRDSVGGVGTPTSDEERTKLSLGTTKLLILFNAYSGKNELEDALAYAQLLLDKYVQSTIIKTFYY